jgi:hypothetical protein
LDFLGSIFNTGTFCDIHLQFGNRVALVGGDSDELALGGPELLDQHAGGALGAEKQNHGLVFLHGAERDLREMCRLGLGIQGRV